MTTAPTPSEKVQRLAITLEIVGAVPDMNYVTVPRHVARDASVELRRLQAENERLRAEMTMPTIEDASQEWGKVDPAIAWHLIERHADSWADIGKMMTEYVQAQIARAELEARKPLPLSIERLEQIWASLRSFHGNEPLKCGHVEFARLVEVEYGVLGRIPIREGNGGQIDHSRITGGSS